jgi:uncharacterized membrane protein
MVKEVMDLYFFIKTLHIISSTVLFGTGLGTAFFMLMSMFTNNIQEKFYAVRTTVMADYLFTAPAVVIQPLTGIWLILNGGHDWTAPWLMWTYGLYILAGLCWLPVVWIQIRLKKLVKISIDTNTPLPAEYNRLFKIWFALGWPAFISLIAIFFLMVMKPA